MTAEPFPMPSGYMPSEELVERIARELCYARGDDPGGGFYHIVANASGAPTGAKPVTGTMLDEAKRDVRFVLGWVNMHAKEIV